MATAQDRGSDAFICTTTTNGPLSHASASTNTTITAPSQPAVDDNWPCPDLEPCSYHRRPSWQELEQQHQSKLDSELRATAHHRIHNPFSLSLRSLPPRAVSPAGLASKAAAATAAATPTAAHTSTTINVTRTDAAAAAATPLKAHSHIAANNGRITFLSPFEASFCSNSSFTTATPAVEAPLSPFCLPGSPFTDMDSLASSSPGLPTPSSMASMNAASPCYCYGQASAASSSSASSSRAHHQQHHHALQPADLSLDPSSAHHYHNHLSSSPTSSSPNRVHFAARSPSYQPTSATSEGSLLQTADNLQYRRRSVDVGTLGSARGHQRYGRTSQADAPAAAFVPPDQLKAHRAKKSHNQRNKEFLFAQHLTSILRHSLSLCSIVAPDADIEAWSNATTPRSSISSNSSNGLPSISDRLEAPVRLHTTGVPRRLRLPSLPHISPARRFELIDMIASWSFNANVFDLDELCECACIIFECFLESEGLSKDAGTPARWRTFLVSMRAAYHPQHAYHNFAHAVDVLQACYSFLSHIGVAPNVSRLRQESRSKPWKREAKLNEKGRIGDILRPMDVLALLVAAIGHDVGHPGLTNAYMINARTPAAQVYNDKSVLENFHSVTLIRMLKLHGFGSLLEEVTPPPPPSSSTLPATTPTENGQHGTDFRQILLTSVLVTDMSRHFPFVEKLTEMGERLKKNNYISNEVKEDRLVICSALMKCGDISNPSRPHHVASFWSSALLEEWAVQAEIEAKFELPVSVVTLKSDSKSDERIAQAKSQVGFINLFTQPLFDKMAAAVPSFQLFADYCAAGRVPWEAILKEDEDRKADGASQLDVKTSSSTSEPPKSALSMALAAPHGGVSLSELKIPEYKPAPHRSPWSARGSDFPFDVATPLSPGSASTFGTSPSTTSSFFKDDRSSPSSSATTFSSSSWIPSSAVEAYHPLVEEACTDNCSSITALCASCARRQAQHWNDEDIAENSTETIHTGMASVNNLVASGQWPPEPFRPTPQAKS